MAHEDQEPLIRTLEDEIRSLALDTDYDEDYKPPTDDSIRRGLHFLTDALGRMSREFPVAEPVPDGNGGFRLYWIRPGRNLQLNVPASDASPISMFWRDGFEYSSDQDAKPADLAARLNWFNAP